MWIEIIIILPMYLVMFVVFYQYRPIIKMMNSLNQFLTHTEEELTTIAEKRDFLVEKLREGEHLTKSKTTEWKEKELLKASDKVIARVYDNYKNPEPVQIDRELALKVGRQSGMIPVLAKLYMEAYKKLLPWGDDRYMLDEEEFLESLLSDSDFCDDLAVEIGTELIKNIGEATGRVKLGVTLARHTWNATKLKPEFVQKEQRVGSSSSEIKNVRSDFKTSTICTPSS